MSKYILGDLFKGDFPITQRYGANPLDQNGKPIYYMFTPPGHEGVDWGCPTGTEVVAPFDGIILRDTFNDKDYGNFTVVWDPIQHCAVWYCHLQDVTTATGDKVTLGQVVGHTNNTGHSTGPHLHVDFVETDGTGNRLNLDNGKQGFLDILDPNLVEWKLGGSMPNPTPQPDNSQPMKQIVIDAYTAILGVGPSDDEIKARLDSQINTHDLILDLLNNDGRSPLKALNQKISDLTSVNAQQANMINSYIKEVSDLNGQLDDLRKQLKACQNQPPTGFIPKTKLGKFFYSLARSRG